MKVQINYAGSKDLWQAITFMYMSRDFEKKKSENISNITIERQGGKIVLKPLLEVNWQPKTKGKHSNVLHAYCY